MPRRNRIHTDNSVEVKYFDRPDRTLDKMAFSLTGDLGCEYGNGVSCYGNHKGGPKQSFVGYMAYNRFWFHKDTFGLTLGGGQINNPGRYLVLLASDQWRNCCYRFDEFTILYRKSRRSLQGVGLIDHVRLHAEAIHHVPLGV